MALEKLFPISLNPGDAKALQDSSPQIQPAIIESPEGFFSLDPLTTFHILDRNPTIRAHVWETIYYWFTQTTPESLRDNLESERRRRGGALPSHIVIEGNTYLEQLRQASVNMKHILTEADKLGVTHGPEGILPSYTLLRRQVQHNLETPIDPLEQSA